MEEESRALSGGERLHLLLVQDAGWVGSGLSTSFPLRDYTPGIHLSPWLQVLGGCQ